MSTAEVRGKAKRLRAGKRRAKKYVEPGVKYDGLKPPPSMRGKV